MTTVTECVWFGPRPVAIGSKDGAVTTGRAVTLEEVVPAEWRDPAKDARSYKPAPVMIEPEPDPFPITQVRPGAIRPKPVKRGKCRRTCKTPIGCTCGKKG